MMIIINHHGNINQNILIFNHSPVLIGIFIKETTIDKDSREGTLTECW